MSRVRFRSGMVASRPGPAPPSFLILPPEVSQPPDLPAAPERSPMLTATHIKAAAIGLALIALIGSGWTARGWYEDSKDLAAAAAIEKSREIMRDLANEVATKTENAIGGIRVENKTIYQQATKEVVRDVVYRDCRLTDDGLRAANSARRRPAPGKPADPVPGSANAP